MDKYLSVITNFGCHYQCPECVVKNNGLKMSKTNKWSSVEGLTSVLKDNPDINWVSVSGGGDPLFHWWENQLWWRYFFYTCKREYNKKIELHTSYKSTDEQFWFFPFERFDRVVYHCHSIEDLYSIGRKGKEIVRVVFVVSDDMTEDDIKEIADFVKICPNIDELSFRQRVDENYNTTYHLHDFLKAGHKKDWWYIEQNDYNLYYHNGKVYTKYRDIFE